MNTIKFKFIVFLVLCFHFLSAQNDFIILNNNDTISGQITYRNANGHYLEKIKFVLNDNAGNNITRRISANEIKGFKCGENMLFSMPVFDSYLIGPAINKIFVQKVLKGKLELFSRDELYNSAKFGGHNQAELQTVYFFKKQVDNRLVPAKMNKKAFLSYFSDCRVTLNKYKNQHIVDNNIRNLVESYNSCNEHFLTTSN